jgi:hypothetical protein
VILSPRDSDYAQGENWLYWGGGNTGDGSVNYADAYVCVFCFLFTREGENRKENGRKEFLKFKNSEYFRN